MRNEDLTATIDNAIEALARRDRVVVSSVLIIVIGLSWAYLLAGAGTDMPAMQMTGMSQPGMARVMKPAVWTPGYAVLMFFMWWIMMVAMMLPSAAPMILLFATINRRQREPGHPRVATFIFASGYLFVWAAFSVAAMFLQWMLEMAGLLSPALVVTNFIFGSILLLAAGIYQCTSIKHTCLRHCRSPQTFLMSHWQHSARGALRMGFRHGAFCVGCCWFLMGLLFFGGVMNLYWIVGIAMFILLEKTVPAGHWFSYATGIALLAWGSVMLIFAL